MCLCAIIARQRIQEKESTFYSETCDHSTCMYMRVFVCRVAQEVAERERARESDGERGRARESEGETEAGEMCVTI